MYIDSLATALIILRDLRGWTIEEAAGHCNISSRYFGDILRRKCNPGIDTLEKLCNGFSVHPNDVLKFQELNKMRREYQEQSIAQCYCIKNINAFQLYPVCPKYRESFLKEYKALCNRCIGTLCGNGKACQLIEKMLTGCNRY